MVGFSADGLFGGHYQPWWMVIIQLFWMDGGEAFESSSRRKRFKYSCFITLHVDLTNNGLKNDLFDVVK